jgi:hypothetical protein
MGACPPLMAIYARPRAMQITKSAIGIESVTQDSTSQMPSSIYMRRRGIENASKEPSAVNPAIDQNAMRKAWEISA